MLEKFFGKELHIAILFAAIVVILLIVLWFAYGVLLLTFAGILLAVFLYSLSDWISKKTKLPHSIALTVVIVFLLIAIGLTIWALSPTIITQMYQLINKLPDSWKRIDGWLQTNFNMHIDEDTIAKWLPNHQDIFSRTTQFFSSTFGAITSFIFFIFLGVYLAYAPQQYLDGIVDFISQKKQRQAKDIFYAMGKTLRLWLLGKLLSMIIVGVCTSLGLWIIGVPLALTLGLIAAVMTFIPNIGPVLGAIPAVLIALLQSPIQAVIVITFYVILQIFESYLVTPIIQRKTIDLPPATILVAQLFIGYLAGGLGLALATPIAAVLIVLIKNLNDSHLKKQS